jgi:hypothetical protein
MASGDDKAAQQAEHVAAPTTKVQCSIIPCQRGAVHTGRKAVITPRRAMEPREALFEEAKIRAANWAPAFL